MLLHRSIHRPIPSPDLPNNSSYLNSGNPLTPRESPMADSGSQTIIPALLVNRSSMLSDGSHDALYQFPRLSYTGQECSYTWPRSEQSATFGLISSEYHVEPSCSPIPLRTCFGNFEDEAKGECDGSMGPHQQLPTPFSSSSSSFNNYSSGMDQELTPPAQSNSAIRSPVLTSILPSQSSHWADFTAANNADVTRTRPRFIPPQAYVHDTAPSLGSSLYATSSDLRMLTQPQLHRPFRETGRLETLDSESESESKQGEPPYAKLIYRALMEAPEHQMVLKDIYEWIAQNTDKARDPAFKGWQNSVRHNLSMNGAFRKVPHVDPLNKAKKGFIWVLEPSAVGVGIESTTRFRQKTASRRSENVDRADPKRQRSGRKGGRAARKSTKLRRSGLREHDARHPPNPKRELSMTFNALPDELPRQVSPHQDWNSTGGLPYYLTPPLSSTQPSFPDNGIYEYRGMTENPDIQQNWIVFDRQDQVLFGNSFNSGCESMRQEGSGIVKFEDHYLANRLTALS